MAESPMTEDTELISYEITADGTVLPPDSEVLSITVEAGINQIASAEIELIDGDPSTESFELSASSTFKPGAAVEIKLGYSNSNETVFKGVVTKQVIRTDQLIGASLLVVCRDQALASTIARKNAMFENVTDSSIMQTILGNYSFDADVASTSTELKEVVQFYATDWDFVVSRAEVNGMVVFAQNNKVTIAKPAVSASPALSVTYGKDIYEFEAELDAVSQLSAVQGTGWDMSSQAVINATAAEPSVNSQGNASGSSLAEVLSAGQTNLASSVPLSQDGLQGWADAALLKSRLSLFGGTISFQGSAKALPNTTIQMGGMGERFNGTAIVSAVKHTLEEGNWLTEVTIGISSAWFASDPKVTEPSAAGLLPGVRGLQTATVKQTYQDPDNQFRVQVELPTMATQGKMLWARLATFYNGSGVGALFMPEVGDEVVLGFMNDDPRFAVILGSLYSSSIAPPVTPDEENTIKTIMTKSKLQIEFDDDKKVLTIVTPGGNKICLSDEDKGITITDQNGNKAEFNSDGINIESQSALTLKAATKVSIEGAQVSINGDEQVTATGGTVSITGNETVSISGEAECTVSSSGETSVKGSMVMIN